MNIDQFAQQFMETTGMTRQEIDSDGVERVFFEHAQRLNPELQSLKFTINDQARYAVENDKLVIAYKGIDSRQKLLQIAKAYNEHYDGIRVNITDWEDKSQKSPNFYFALVIDVNTFLNKALPDHVNNTIPDKVKQPHQTEFVDIRSPSVLIKYGFRKNPYRGGYVYPHGLSLLPSSPTQNHDKPVVSSKSMATTDQKEQLMTLIMSICTNYDYWKDKVRVGTAVGDKVLPDGIAKFIDIHKNNNLDSALQLIGQTSDHKHSSYFQFAHSFFRGRDAKTNELYGILAQLGKGLDTTTVDTVIKNLKEKFPVDIVADEKSRLLL